MFLRESIEGHVLLDGWLVRCRGRVARRRGRPGSQPTTAVCRLFVFLKRVEILSSLTERVQRVSVKCINSQLCFFVKQLRKQT